MTRAEQDIVIVGGGCVGSSIAFHLVRRGFKNVALVDNGRKSVSATSQSGGMLRVFHESSEHVNLALRNFEHVKNLTASKVLSETNKPNGSLYFFDRRRFRDYEANLERMETANYPFEVVTQKLGQQRFPWYEWANGHWAIYEPLGNHLNPTTFCDDLLSHSQNSGLTLLDGFEVDRICYFQNRYRLFSGQKSISTKNLVLAGGVRMIPYLKELGIGHSLKAKEITVYRSKAKADNFNPPNFFDRETLRYAGKVSGQHLVTSDISSPIFGRAYLKNDFDIITGFDCYAPHRMGYAGFLAGHPRCLLATGWGGTAFKFSLEIGSRISRVLESEHSDRSIIHA